MELKTEVDKLERSECTIIRVPEEALFHYWADMEKYLDASRELWETLHTKEAIFAMLQTGRLQLWVAFDKNGELVLCTLTELLLFSQQKVCRILWMKGAKFFDGIIQLGISAIENFAIENECSSLYIEGRKGWEKTMSSFGYEFAHVVVRKSLRKERAN